MLKTLITFGWLGDFGKLRNAAKKNKLAKCLYRLYVEKHQSYIPLYADLSDDIWFPHLTGIHIAGATHIGSGCTIYQHVTLGSNYLEGTKHPGAPTIGNNVLIGAGVRIVGGGENRRQFAHWSRVRRCG